MRIAATDSEQGSAIRWVARLFQYFMPLSYAIAASKEASKQLAAFLQSKVPDPWKESLMDTVTEVRKLAEQQSLLQQKLGSLFHKAESEAPARQKLPQNNHYMIAAKMFERLAQSEDTRTLLMAITCGDASREALALMAQLPEHDEDELEISDDLSAFLARCPGFDPDARRGVLDLSSWPAEYQDAVRLFARLETVYGVIATHIRLTGIENTRALCKAQAMCDARNGEEWLALAQAIDSHERATQRLGTTAVHLAQYLDVPDDEPHAIARSFMNRYLARTDAPIVAVAHALTEWLEESEARKAAQKLSGYLRPDVAQGDIAALLATCERLPVVRIRELVGTDEILTPETDETLDHGDRSE